MKAHPLQVAAFTCVFSVLSTAMAFREDWIIFGRFQFGVLLIILGISIWKGLGKLPVALLTILALISQSEYGQEIRIQKDDPVQPLGPCSAIGIATVVIVVGGIIIYKTVKFCQRKFPKVPPPPPPNTNDTDIVSASYNWDYLGSCWVEDPCYGGNVDGSNYTTTTITVTVGWSGSTSSVVALPANDLVRATLTTTRGEAGVQSWIEFQEAVAQYGVLVTGNGDQSQYFARNGQPISAAESPVTFDSVTHAVILRNDTDGPVYTITLERSTDLRRWSPILRSSVPFGKTFAVEDAGWEPQVFYRLSSVQTN